MPRPECLGGLPLHPEISPRYKYVGARPRQRKKKEQYQMALDMEKEFERHQKGWDDFARMLFIGTVSIIAIVGLMAIFLT